MQERRTNYLSVTWLAKLMAGEVSCAWATWFRVHYQGYERRPFEGDLAAWTVQHTQLVNELATRRARLGERVWQEAQVAFRLPLRPDLQLGGRPDLVTCNAVGEIRVYEVKTGRPRQSHVVQTLLYLACLPAVYPELRGHPLDGRVVYKDGTETRVEGRAADGRFRDAARNFVDIVNAPTPPVHVASQSECRFCDITKTDCAQRLEVTVPLLARESGPIWHALAA